jgi:hypothetical protein
MLITPEKNIEVLGNGLYLSPEPANTFIEQLKNCHGQLDKIMADLNRHVVLLVYFIDAQTEEEYHALSAALEKIHLSNYRSPFSIVAQAPVDGTKVNVEVHHCCKRANPEYKQFEGFNYCTFHYNNNKYLVSGGLQMKTKKSDLQKQSMESFRLMKGILNSERMDFSHIFRQWNYIESITGTFSDSQRYQIFNDVRSLFYNESDFIQGYPAATGIGMKTGGVIIDFLAAVHDQVWTVKNPDQVDAHKYSDEILANNEFSDQLKSTTPKFERAKAIALEKDILMYISGTAAIKGQVSKAKNDAYQQTLETIDNIEQLTEIKNLTAHHIPVTDPSSIEPGSFKIYVKTADDLKSVRSAFESRFGKMNDVLYLIGDICRPELLMEIEGTYRLRKS